MYAVILTVFVIYFSMGTRGESVSITPNATDLWVRHGKSFNLSCVCSSERDVVPSWYLNGTSLRVNKNVIITAKKFATKGKITSTVNFYKSKIDYSDAGNYTCKTDLASKTIQIKVLRGRLKIYPKTERVITFSSKIATLTCDYEGNQYVDVRWTKGGGNSVKQYGFRTNRQTLNNNGQIMTTVYITKRNVGPLDSDQYTCTAGPFTKTVILEVYDGSCNERLVSGPMGVPDDHITASSYYRDLLYLDAPYRGRLGLVQETTENNEFLSGGWSSGVLDKRQWIQVKFRTQSIIRQVITQGRSSEDCCNQSQWVTKFKLAYSQDGVTWEKYKDLSGNTLYFRANSDHDTPVTQTLQTPITARYLRILPVSWNERISLRFEVKGCFILQNLRMIQPTDSSVNLKLPNSLRISCEYTGPQKIDIHWLKDGANVTTDMGYIYETMDELNGGRITATSSIVRSDARYSDSGNYTCYVPGTVHNRSVTIHAVKLDKLPTITRYWVVASEAVQLTCRYKSRDKRNFAWLYEGRQIDHRKFYINYRTEHTNEGLVVESTISTAHIGLDDSGEYQCLIGGMTRSWDIHILSGTGNGTVQPLQFNKAMYLDCNFTGLTPDVSYELFWTKNGVPVGQTEAKERINYFPNSKTLQITNAKLSDAGRYECNLLLEVGTPQQQQVTFIKEIHAPPNVSVDGQKIANSGDSLHIYCKTSGYPKPSIVWLKNGKPLSESGSRVTFLPYDGMDNGQLVVFDVTTNEAGHYSCTAMSDNFQPVKSELQVDVKQPVVAVSHTTLIAVLTGSGVILFIAVVCGVLRCRKNKRDYNYAPDTNSLDHLRRERKETTRKYTDLDTCERPRITLLTEEPRHFPKRPEMSSLKTISTVETESSTYERLPFRSRVTEEESTCTSIQLDPTSDDEDIK